MLFQDKKQLLEISHPQGETMTMDLFYSVGDPF